MRVFVAISLILCCLYGQGVTALFDLNPYIATLEITVGTTPHTCDGIILNEKFILTVAHCLHNSIAMIKILLFPSLDGTKVYHYTTSYKLHPQFNALTKDYDVGLIINTNPLVLGTNFIPLNLAEAGTRVSNSDKVIAAARSGPVVALVTVPSMSSTACREAYGNYEIDITYRMFCAAYAGKEVAGTCNGKAGDPAINSNGVLVGMLFEGLNCAKKQQPGVYLDIGSVRSWITTKTGI